MKATWNTGVSQDLISEIVMTKIIICDSIEHTSKKVNYYIEKSKLDDFNKNHNQQWDIF